jgi:uracil-DNA glycosylase family protein
MLVGEQPGDQEDLAGRPFVGSAGRVLDEALDEVGLERSRVYVTNAVKHFKWKQRGKRRLHQRPNAGEVAACSPWLVHEIEKVDPRIVVAMGVTALRSMFTGRVTIRAMRGRIETSRFGVPAVVTVHPAAIVRLREREERHAAFEAFVADLRTASDAAKVVEHR